MTINIAVKSYEIIIFKAIYSYLFQQIMKAYNIVVKQV